MRLSGSLPVANARISSWRRPLSLTVLATRFSSALAASLRIADRKVNYYRALPIEFTAAQARTLILELQPAGLAAGLQ